MTTILIGVAAYLVLSLVCSLLFARLMLTGD